ncbi:MAG: nuclear transport factor 2 family protein [Alphaproteobacteria bacterium]|nr:nuclear transport factor 2 family protein [Alphaproteobacteria bacterium]
MKKLVRADYVRLIRKYFGCVTREDYQGVLDCFTPDARVTIFHGDNPVQQFHKNPKRGQKSYDFFYGHLFDNYVVKFTALHCVIDSAERTAAATFVPRLTPKRTSAYRKTGKLQLNNCNFFWYRGDKIADMIIYYANPTLGKKLGLATRQPTAFPK